MTIEISKVHAHPSRVSAEKGVVMVDGPDGVAISLTPEAARETADRLAEAAAMAAAQRSLRDGDDGGG
ncbi:hypothetical protein [Flavisphingomonas formosensis]|uniref:hypothetical protein n=1 Tax=Flavisphingomonas formosensis TaxID=861534 RepID=UPI0012FBA7CF|nr:hypothetical protein [Sphingomonas formosensis]